MYDLHALIVYYATYQSWDMPTRRVGDLEGLISHFKPHPILFLRTLYLNKFCLNQGELGFKLHSLRSSGLLRLTKICLLQDYDTAQIEANCAIATLIILAGRERGNGACTSHSLPQTAGAETQMQ